MICDINGKTHNFSYVMNLKVVKQPEKKSPNVKFFQNLEIRLSTFLCSSDNKLLGVVSIDAGKIKK